ncbi:hypothetical protein PHLGIDRAFT_121299 [Phlebiopsis gigantea 11061_1 CR5-6]|uniref:D-xylose 1-dehydrogenase (NADP(+), D-xylono-1,5-lactone-forming) n=1 Tax=Phlebiopsis gigantea (strain 11061_1 CR5-6) TaxID=745531 RepID=A0A0C3NGA0_PHLG1|nr:hypothetical protein PHLGIDRAFT_121299 [Phlebiopsis gigantea 11061_1 CR5-6]
MEGERELREVFASYCATAVSERATLTFNLGNLPVAAKAEAPLRFGILGAARVAPVTLITPAESHPDVVVAAVAARDRAKAAKYAKYYDIGKFYGGPDAYQELIDDLEIDAVYIALPNIFHYEWAFKALSGGKHVLIEKPITDTEAEAAALITLAEQKGLVLLEVNHYCFHPAAQRAREVVRSGELGKIKSIIGEYAVPNLLALLVFEKNDIRFQYALGGGSMMDVGVYPLSAILYLTGADALKVTRAAAIPHPADPARIDHGMRATLALLDGATAELYCDYRMPGWGPCGLLPCLPKVLLLLDMEGGTVEFFGFTMPQIYHYIQVTPRRRPQRTEKVYRHADGTGDGRWSSYRYQLEAFVDKVRGRTPQYWPSREDSVNQMRAICQVYGKAGMPARPASSFFVEQNST